MCRKQFDYREDLPQCIRTIIINQTTSALKAAINTIQSKMIKLTMIYWPINDDMVLVNHTNELSLSGSNCASCYFTDYPPVINVHLLFFEVLISNCWYGAPCASARKQWIDNKMDDDGLIVWFEALYAYFNNSFLRKCQCVELENS